MIVWLVISLLLTGLASTAYAQNYSCSGSKGGVSHCEGATWVCNDEKAPSAGSFIMNVAQLIC